MSCRERGKKARGALRDLGKTGMHFRTIYSSRSAKMGHSAPATLTLLKHYATFYFLE